MKIDFCRLVEDTRPGKPDTVHRKASFPLRSSLVNMTKSTGNCRFGHIYWGNP